MTHRRSLTRELSEGANPASSPALALRAEELTSARRRRSLARVLRRTVDEALHPLPRRASFGLARRGAVIEAQDAIDILVKRLCSPEPIAAEGVALIERMLGDGAWSPLYNATPAGAQRQLVVLATAASLPEPAGAQLSDPSPAPGSLSAPSRPARSADRYRRTSNVVAVSELATASAAPGGGSCASSWTTVRCARSELDRQGVHVRQPAPHRALPPPRQALLIFEPADL